MWWPVPRLSLLFCSFLASDSVDMRFSSSWELVAHGCPTASLRMHRLTSHSEQSEPKRSRLWCVFELAAFRKATRLTWGARPALKVNMAACSIDTADIACNSAQQHDTTSVSPGKRAKQAPQTQVPTVLAYAKQDERRRASDLHNYSEGVDHLVNNIDRISKSKLFGAVGVVVKGMRALFGVEGHSWWVLSADVQETLMRVLV